MKNYKAKKLTEAAANSVKPSTVTTAVASAPEKKLKETKLAG